MGTKHLTNQYAVAALKYRRGLLAGEIAQLEKQIGWKRQQIEHLDGTLHLMGQDPDKIRNVKHYKRIQLFKQGELSQTVRDVLRRRAKPMSNQEVVLGVIAALGHDDRTLYTMKGRVTSSLQYLKRTGAAVMTYKGRLALWSLSTT